MFNPLLSLQMAWADDKLTNSFWYVIHDLFSVSGNTFFLKEKTKPQKHSITRKKKNQFVFQAIIAKSFRIRNVQHFPYGSSVWLQPLHCAECMAIPVQDQNTWVTSGKSSSKTLLAWFYLPRTHKPLNSIMSAHLTVMLANETAQPTASDSNWNWWFGGWPYDS